MQLVEQDTYKQPVTSRSQWPRGLRRGSAAAPLLGLWFRIPQMAYMFFSSECCVSSGTGLYLGLITPPECGVSECGREASTH
jgi:hypothetical protein